MVSTRDRLKQTKEKLVSPLTIHRKPNSKNDDLEIDDSNERLTILETTVSDLTSTAGELVKQLRLTNLAKASASVKRRDRSKKKKVMKVDGDGDIAEIDSDSSDAESFIYEAAINNCVELAIDRYGCVVLQRCLILADVEQRRLLVSEVIVNALNLSQDQYGNYVVQCVLELELPWAIVDMLNQLKGNYVYLSIQKYSSNVVEKCLKFSGEDCRSQIVHELLSDLQLDQILQDRYGNYVIQAALQHSKGAAHAALVKAIWLNVPVLETSPYGKKILSHNSLKE
ncbi:hypothetical protein GIB67_021553 [Kingdonia uniflora]|uniref:PUM-HD domain-containing protein n=1 Tax=Kingdonia uniflora TaxID=39325 RepID=A0A7J7L9R8_9MAGN|nr:hypothetical protein GIB67_021553 [Kingdonia uniflora]